MTARLSRALLILLMPLALASCVLTPGKFISTLRIDADRHFAFSYVGEVIAVDLGDAFINGFDEGGKNTVKEGESKNDPDPAATGDDDTPSMQKIAGQKERTPDDKAAAKKAAADTKNRAIATALAKEAGYRKVTYLGEGKFGIDYAIAGTLDRGFVWPFNLDAEIVFPFVVLEVRNNNSVRVRAPGFANDSNATKTMGMPAPDKAPSQLDGSFTLDTDAEIISQNNEDGAVTSANGRKTVTWKATPTTRDAPTAVLRVK